MDRGDAEVVLDTTSTVWRRPLAPGRALARAWRATGLLSRHPLAGILAFVVCIGSAALFSTGVATSYEAMAEVQLTASPPLSIAKILSREFAAIERRLAVPRGSSIQFWARPGDQEVRLFGRAHNRSAALAVATVYAAEIAAWDGVVDRKALEARVGPSWRQFVRGQGSTWAIDAQLGNLERVRGGAPAIRVVGTRKLRGSNLFVAAALAVPAGLLLAVVAATALEIGGRRRLLP